MDYLGLLKALRVGYKMMRASGSTRLVIKAMTKPFAKAYFTTIFNSATEVIVDEVADKYFKQEKK